MLRETRTFFNTKTNRNEVWLDRVGILWLVFEEGEDEQVREYPDTDEGYRAAQLDYGARVAQRVYGDDLPPGVYFGFNNATPETVDFLIENAGNCEEIIGARIDKPRARSIARWLSHWAEHGTLPEDKTGEEWLFVRAWPDGRSKARDAARRLFGALQAEWKDRPDTHPLLAELVAEHPWIENDV